MRKTTFSSKEFYHICGRGIMKNVLFFDDQDYARFLFLILHLQSPTPMNNISWYANSFVRKDKFPVGEDLLGMILKERYLNIVAFCLMPNHFHIILENKEEMVPSVYMQRVLTSYSKYFNAKYKRTGHVFEGPFRDVHIKDNTQLLHTSAYIHKNPKEYKDYKWSSYKDYVDTNRWGKLLETEVISGQFKTQSLYRDFVNSSTAKESLEDLT